MQGKKDTDATAPKSNLTHQCIHFKPVKRPAYSQSPACLIFISGPVVSKPGFLTSLTGKTSIIRETVLADKHQQLKACYSTVSDSIRLDFFFFSNIFYLIQMPFKFS